LVSHLEDTHLDIVYQIVQYALGVMQYNIKDTQQTIGCKNIKKI